MSRMAEKEHWLRRFGGGSLRILILAGGHSADIGMLMKDILREVGWPSA